MRPIRITVETDQDEQLWSLTAELAGLLADLEWVLIGGQMIAILEAEHGGTIGRATTDVDVLVEASRNMTGPQITANRLMRAGFEPKVASLASVYRFVRRA